MGRRVVHFLLHVPKCAGTTVEEHFRAALGPAFLIAPRWENPLRNLLGNRYDYAPGDPRLTGVRAVSGHSLSAGLERHFAGADIRASVLLRDPVGYHLSLYNYRWTWHRLGHGPKPPEFSRWYAAQRRNPIARFLLTRYFGWGVPALYALSSAGRLDWLEARLTGFHFVGDYRRAGEMIARISAELGVPGAVQDRNVTAERVVTEQGLGAGWCARIAVDNALDAALHARWKDRGWSGGGSSGASSPAGAAHAGGMRAPSRPARAGLPAWDQPRHILGDLVSGIAKKLVR